MVIMHLTEHQYPDTAICANSESSEAAGAPVSPVEKTKPSADGFGSIQDILDGVEPFIENCNRRLALQGSNSVNAYLKFKVSMRVSEVDPVGGTRGRGN